MDEILKKVEEHFKFGCVTKTFVYADDILIWGENEDEVQMKSNKWNECDRKFWHENK
jgi:hypothetical protein